MKNTNNISLPLRHQIQLPRIQQLKSPAVFFLHGFGSNMDDLFTLGNYFPSNWTCISLEATVSIGFGGWAWAELDFNNMLELPKPEQIYKHRTKIIQSIKISIQKLKLDSSQIYLVGFSQGASMSLFCGLTRPEMFHGIASLCGYIELNDFSKEINKDKVSELNLFIGNGTEDNVVPISLGRLTKTNLERVGVQPIYQEYPAGHNISNDCLQDMLKWFKGLSSF
ncbi:MAG: alpha/beta hydrolase-fold protein [Candidatus Marinimicrobia bacterium]|nr:alpha/beta hydrolase-fold protein [Candidatus Neomarinimicrobiota bacterium]